MRSEPILSLEDVACARGGVPVLSAVSFTVAAGEAVVLRGPNGSGKTTLLRTVAGLQPALAGRVWSDSGIAYSGHADGVKGALSVRENLAFWADMFATSGTEEAMRAFDLWAMRDRAAQHLSAGQRRRLGLARLMVAGCALWVLDEPTVSLDQASVTLFAGVLERHLAAGYAALIATHIDLGLAAREIDVAQFRARAETMGVAFA